MYNICNKIYFIIKEIVFIPTSYILFIKLLYFIRGVVQLIKKKKVWLIKKRDIISKKRGTNNSFLIFSKMLLITFLFLPDLEPI